MKRRIVIADDEKNTREGLKWAIEGKGVEVGLAADGQEALDILATQDVDLVIADLKMPRIDGMELLRRIKEEYPGTEVIVLTGHGTVETAVEAMKIGAYDYVIKPVNLDELNLLVERALMLRSMKEENLLLHRQLDERYGFDKIIGRSPAIMKVFRKIKQVAPSRATVLIQGESGTGKELIASAIHYNSPRKNKPFVKINCGALSPTLLESELFGHEKGAFTDAYKQKQGRFELANEGTIFLDEVSETTQEFQVKLLRVLQEQEFERVGGTRTIKVDVRVIAATNTNLEERVRQGRFREDLFYRLNVIQINLVPLRERTEDIPLLVNEFLKEFCQEYGKEILDVSPKVMSILQQYNWPGNVRQLRNVIEGMVVMATSRELTPKSLPEEIRKQVDQGRFLKLKTGSTLREAERELIKATLLDVNGNKAKAARMLGLGRKTLYRKLQEYGIE
jgi:DNA-binding NtrC family response regulator